jgi:hypothetical protein
VRRPGHTHGKSHPAEILRQRAKDERRQFTFCHSKAKFQPQERKAQRLTTLGIQHFWLPAGGGAKSDAEVTSILSYILRGQEGGSFARRIDVASARLPILGWFHRLVECQEDSFRRSSPPHTSQGVMALLNNGTGVSRANFGARSGPGHFLRAHNFIEFLP